MGIFLGCYSGNPQDTRLIDFDDIFCGKWTLLVCFCTALLPDMITQCVTLDLMSISLEFLLSVAHFLVLLILSCLGLLPISSVYSKTNHCCCQGKSQNESHPVCQVVSPQKTTYPQIVRIENVNATQSLSYIRMALRDQQEKHLFLLLYCYDMLLFKTLVCWKSSRHEINFMN